MLSRLALIAVLLGFGPGCKGKEVALGGACEKDGDCRSGLLCWRSECLQEQSVRHMRAAEARSGAAEGEAAPRKVGDRIEVEWKGAWQPATIVGVVATGSYRVHYEGHDAEWDEVIGEGRIKGGARKLRGL